MVFKTYRKIPKPGILESSISAAAALRPLPRPMLSVGEVQVQSEKSGKGCLGGRLEITKIMG